MTIYLTIGLCLAILNIILGMILKIEFPPIDGFLDACATLLVWAFLIVVWPIQVHIIIRGFVKGFKGTREESD